MLVVKRMIEERVLFLEVDFEGGAPRRKGGPEGEGAQKGGVLA
jgi:hypothetical protein